MKHLILSLVICCSMAMGNAWGSDLDAGGQKGMNYSDASVLFDSRTGHKYIKRADNSYDEYSKKGKYLKTVRADLPVLVKSKHVYPITEIAVMLFDARTAHKYIKKSENSYAEYSKKGKYLKTVRADLPLLMDSKHVYPITESAYILYKKVGFRINEYTVLPATTSHPNGCKTVKMLVALD